MFKYLFNYNYFCKNLLYANMLAKVTQIYMQQTYIGINLNLFLAVRQTYGQKHITYSITLMKKLVCAYAASCDAQCTLTCVDG